MTRYPSISPLASETARPFWSVMIPTYDPDPEYFEQTLAGVLEQDPGASDMEIVVVDDHSRTNPAPFLESDRVSLFRQERHAGIAGNWNTCIERARGRWVHILHQDDIVHRGFYDRLRAGIEASPTVGAAVCRDNVIDPDGRELQVQPLIRATAGILDDWIEHVFVALHLRASAIVVRRDVYETIGGFSPDLRYALDWDMWKRIAAAYPIWYEPDVLLSYRRHSDSASFGFMRSGTNIAEIRRSIELSEPLLEPAIAADVTRRARSSYTTYAVASAVRAFLRRDVASGFGQIREARRLASTPGLVATIVRVLARERSALR